MPFLDMEGLKKYTSKILSLFDDFVPTTRKINGKPLTSDIITHTSGEGVVIKNNTISLTTPTRGIYTQAEYDALPEEEKNKGLYVVDDGTAIKIIVNGAEVDIPSFGSLSGPCCGGFRTYSTEETVVGRWIDGKPVYGRVITGLQSPARGETGHNFSSSYLEYGQDALQVDSVVSMMGLIWNNNDTFENLPIVTTNADGKVNSVRLSWAKSALRVYIMSVLESSWYERPVIVILEYTKTTDEPGANIPTCCGTASSDTIEEYDTGTGWHVRKWPNGYCELIYSAPVEFAEWTEWTAPIWQAKNADGTHGVGRKSLPIAITERLYENANIYTGGNVCMTYATVPSSYDLSTTYNYNVYRPGGPGGLSGYINIFIAARWDSATQAVPVGSAVLLDKTDDSKETVESGTHLSVYVPDLDGIAFTAESEATRITSESEPSSTLRANGDSF